MCPDANLWSAYADGEVPSPWKERMREHAASCPDCAGKLESFVRLDARLSGIMGPAEIAALEAARAAVGKNLESARATRQPAPGPRRAPLLLPFPAVLAAAAIAVAVFAAGLAAGYLGIGRGGLALAALRGVSGSAAASSPAATVLQPAGATLAASASSLEALASYLDSQGASQAVIIRLPSDASFQTPGNPVIMTSVQDSGK